MNIASAVTALAALAQETRLQLFRRLVAAGPAGVPAGVLAKALRIAPSNLTFHAQALEAAGLAQSRRLGRSNIYALKPDGMRALLGFLVDDCCGGAPELCLPDPASAPCCSPQPAPPKPNIQPKRVRQ